MRKKFLLTMFSLVLFAFCGTSLHAEDYVAKVGNTEYATIDEAIAKWSNNTTLTLLADVTLSDVIKLSSTEYHVLDLGTYTMTAASKKDAIQIVNNGRTSASYALDIKADETNPGGITASGKAVVKTTGKSGVKDRPIIRFYGGVLTGTNVVYHSGSNGTNCPQFYFYGGVFNGTIYANRALFQFYGGTFNGDIQISVDSSAYALVSGGRFAKLSNLYGSALNSDKFTIGSSKGNYNRGIYVDAEGYYVVTSEVITEVSAKYPAVKKESYNSNNYFYYSAANTYGMFYEVASMAGTGSNVTIWEKPAVTIPETLTGDVVEEIKNNTALKGYTPENLPAGAELEIELKSVGETFVYDVTPMANGVEVEPTEAITFRLPVPASVTKTYAKVYHEGTSIGIYAIQGEGNAKYVEVSSADFSEFAVEPITHYEVATYQDLIAALANDGAFVRMTANITATATQSSGYGKAGIVVDAGDVLDGNGNTLTINGAGATWDCAIAMRGGEVKNLTIAGAMRGVFMPGANGDVVIDNCVFENVIYTFNSDAGSKEYTVTIKNTTLNGWTSFSNAHEAVVFESCEFGKGSGYAFCRPYQATTFIDCEFNEGYEFDTKSTTEVLAFNECTYNGEALSADNNAMFYNGGSVVINGEETDVNHYVATIDANKYLTLEAAFTAATETQTITLLADATPALISQRAITKAAVIDLGGKTLTLTEDDLYFGTTTFQNGTIVVDPSVKPSTAVFWMFANQTLTFDAVKVVATGVTGTYLIGLDGNNSDLNLLNGSEILVENTTALDLDIICVNASTGNDINVENSKVNVTNLDGRVFFRGNYTVKDSEVNLAGITKAGFRIEAGQTLSIEGTSKVNIEGEPRDGGIHLTDLTATYTKDEEATVNATINEVKAIATINGTKYASLQAAINAVKNGEEITLVSDVTENVTLTEKVDLRYTIDGAGKTMNGTITVNSLSDTEDNRRITVKNIKFVDTADANVDFISSVNTNHYPRLTIEGCTFKGSGNDGDVAVRLKSSHSVVIKDCTGTGLHSFLQNTSGWNLTIENVTVTESKSAFALGTVQGVTVKGCEIAVAGYGIRMDAQYNNNAVIESNKVAAFIPVVVRKASVESNIAFKGENTMNATNTDGIWCAIGTSEYGENGTMPTAATGKVRVTLNDTELSYEGVYGNYYELAGEGTAENPYLINSVYDLKYFRDKVDEQAQDGSTQFAGKYFKLTADLDLAGINWNPIGSMSGDHGSFKGVFDGGNHTISNLNCEQAGNGLGLFARTAGNAEIKNLKLNNVTVKSTDNSNYVGGVVGNAYASTKINNVHVSGTINIAGRGYIGGIAGHGYVVMDKVSVVAKEGSLITSTFWCAGGILGYAGEGSTNIMNANVEGITITSAAGGLGAIVGMAEDNNGTQPISGSNLSAKNVDIKTYVGAYGTSYANYALGYLYGGNETSILTGELSVENVNVITSTGEKAKVVDAVANVDGAIYFNITEAFAAAQDGDNVAILKAGTYTVPSGKDLTITGDVDGVVFANIGAHNMGGANVTFNNVTFTYANNSTYKGLQHSGNLVYNNCTFNGQVFLYGASETFNNCTFNTTDSNNYNVWTYGAKEVAFNKCTFNCAGKSVLIYAESATVFNDVTVTACTFIASTAVDGKAAIEMDSSLTGGINLTISNTTATGFGNGNVSGNSLWNNKKGNADAANNDITVKVGDDVVLAPIYEAQIGEVKYRKLADAFVAAQAGDVVTVFAGTYAMPSMKAGITIVGEGKVVFNGTLSGTLENLTMKNIHIKGSDAQRWAYANGNLLFENVTFEATSVYALHFDGITAGATLLYKDCTIIGWAALGGSPTSCTFDGCTIKGNGTYGVIRTYFDATIKNCKFDVANVNTTDNYQDGIHAVEGAKVTVTNCTNVNGDMKDLVNVHANSVVTVDGVAIKNLAKVGNNYYLTLQDAFAAVGGGAVVIELLDNATLNYGAREAYGTAETTSLTINGNGKVLTLNQTNSDWSSFGLANADAKVVFNNMTIEKTGKGDTSGAWNTHAIIFSSNVEMQDVVVNNSMAVQAGATLNNVTINEANGYYGLWINGNGQTVTMIGGSITATNGGRGIKIADQYIDNPAQVKLNVTGTAFTTAKKAAVLVSSKAGAEIAASNVNIENVAEDTVNFVWVDEDWAANYGNVEVTGAKVAQEGIENFVAAVEKDAKVQAYYKDLKDAFAAAKAGDVVKVFAGTYAMPSMKAGITIEGVDGVILEGTLTGTLENLTMKNIHIKGANAQRWAYAKGNLVFENVTFEATSVYALHFDGIAAGTNLTYKDCTIIGWAAMGGSPASCTFDGCTIKGNGTYGVIRTYFDATIKNCTFDVANVNTTDTYQDGIHAVEGATVTVNGCTNVNGNMNDVVNVHGTSMVVLDGKKIRNVAKIGGVSYTSLQAAIDAANDDDIITLSYVEANGPIEMNASLYGKDVTISGTATVDWSKGFLFVGRGGEGNATLTFDGANLTSASNSASYGIHVSGREKGTNNKYDGTVVIKNSTIVLDYLINKGVMTLDNATLTVKNGFAIGGRPASETESGNDATATIALTNGSKVVVNNHNGMGLGYEAIGIMNVDATSTFETTQSFLVTAKGTMNIAGTAKVAGTLTNNGAINFTADAAVLETTNAELTIGYDINQDKKVVYREGAYKVVDKVYVAQVGTQKFETLQDAVNAVEDGGTITLIGNVTFTETTRTHNSGTWYDGLYYIGDKSFTIDLGGFTIGQDGSVNDYLLNFKNVGSKANTITLKNGTLDAATNAYCAICTSSAQENQLTINTEDLNVINDISNGSTIKVRGGVVLNVKDGTVITGKNSYLGIECIASTVNIYDGAEIYMNGTSSYNGCLAGVGGNGTINVYGGYGKGVKGGFIAMTSGGTINIDGGEWIANTDGTVGNNSNLYVLTAQSNKYESGFAGPSIINVTGGTFRGGMDAWVLNNIEGEKAELNISGGNFNADPSAYVIENFSAVQTGPNAWVVKQTAGELTRTLPQGWSWFSSYVDLYEGVEGDGLAVLENALGENGVQIKDNAGQTFVNYSNGRWRGSLATVSSETMYAIKTSAEHTLEITGEFYDINEYEVSLRNGWNYLSYPYHKVLDMSVAFSGFTPKFGDVIKDKSGNNALYLGESWLCSGDDDKFSFVPGEGYMYYSTEANMLSYSTEINTRSSSRLYVSESSEYWTVDASQYPSNMTMIATLDVEGTDYEVAAFVNGEVRGSARPVYVDYLDQYIVLMTIHGENVANVTFKYYDLNAGEEYDFNNVVVYSNNAILGSIESPYALTRGTTGIDESSINSINIYPNPTTTDREINLQATCDKVEVFNTLGVKVAEYQNVDSIDALETAGTYVIRVTLNGDVKHCRLIVK